MLLITWSFKHDRVVDWKAAATAAAAAAAATVTTTTTAEAAAADEKEEVVKSRGKLEAHVYFWDDLFLK